MKQLKNDKSGILLSLTQPLNVNTPYSGLPINDAFSNTATDNSSILINIDNFFILPSRSLSSSTENEFSLDLPSGNGTKVYMLTHEKQTNADGSVDIFVYRYASINNVDYNNVQSNGTTSSSLQTITLKFLQREYKKLTITSSDFANAFTQLSTSGLPAGTKLSQVYDAFIASRASAFDNLPWILDTSLSDEQKELVYANIQCYTKRSQQTIPPKIFTTRPDGKSKSFIVHKYPLYTIYDKLGRKTFQISSWGSIITNTIVTSSMSLTTSKNETTAGNFGNILQSHQTGWGLNPISKPEN